MATSPNFNWPEPDNTDLVKNGALAIRTAVNAIDTSLVDLKGGTTGQVLAKATNTDMDFSWVAQDDSNAIQNAIVDAKGDLIAASAADTPARLAVGADFAFLKADSSQSTGLAWDNAAWTSWTPTITANSGSFTTVSSTGQYKRVGKICFVRQTITITTNGTAAGTVNSTIPFTGTNIFIGVFREDQSTGALGQISVGSTTAVFRKNDNTYPGGSGYRFEASYFYEVA